MYAHLGISIKHFYNAKKIADEKSQLSLSAHKNLNLMQSFSLTLQTSLASNKNVHYGVCVNHCMCE